MKRTELDLDREILRLVDERMALQAQVADLDRELQLIPTSSPLETAISLSEGQLRIAVTDKSRLKTATREKRISDLKSQIGERKSRIKPLADQINQLQAEVAKLRADSEAKRHGRYLSAVRVAVEASPLRQAYREAADRLANLRKQLVNTQSELDRIQANPPKAADTAEERAQTLVKTGQLPAAEMEATVEARTRVLISRVRTLERAVAILEGQALQAGREFRTDVVERLRPAMEGIVQAIAAGYAQAREAALDATVLRATFGAQCGDPDAMPSLTYRAIQVANPNQHSGFDFWLDAQRRAGFAV